MKFPSTLSVADLLALVIAWLNEALAAWIAAREMAAGTPPPNTLAEIADRHAEAGTGNDAAGVFRGDVADDAGAIPERRAVRGSLATSAGASAGVPHAECDVADGDDADGDDAFKGATGKGLATRGCVGAGQRWACGRVSADWKPCVWRNLALPSEAPSFVHFVTIS